jgi:hypothetical protein
MTDKSDPKQPNKNSEAAEVGCGCLILIAIAFWLLTFCGGEDKRQASSPEASSPPIETPVVNTPLPSSEPPPTPDEPKDPAKSELAYQFCYALEASSRCDNVSMRLDTPVKFQEQIGGDFRGLNTLYGRDCMEGIQAALTLLEPEGASEEIDAAERQHCPTFEADYGCYGTKIPGLLQSNVSNPNGDFCEYIPAGTLPAPELEPEPESEPEPAWESESEPEPEWESAPPAQAPTSSVGGQPWTDSGATAEGQPLRDPVSGSCDCPYDTRSDGRSCGGNSAYYRGQGDAPRCFTGDP